MLSIESAEPDFMPFCFASRAANAAEFVAQQTAENSRTSFGQFLLPFATKHPTQ